MAQKALFAMHQRCADLCIKDLLTRCSLFSFWVQPVLPYGCEVWGIEYFIYICSPLTGVYNTYTKRILHDACQYELGRVPLCLF